jgi:DNA-binding transcriptional LysR family regulator
MFAIKAGLHWDQPVNNDFLTSEPSDKMMPAVDPHLLPDVLVFLTVVRSGSITKAAHQLNTVQSNVTARIKKLEEAFGVPLLSRHARGVRLTSGGEAVLPMALRLDALLNDLGFAFGGRMPVREAKLRLGAIETVAAVHLPRLVSRFLARFPHVDISVQAGSSSRLVKQVKDGDLDAVFVSRAFGLADLREEMVFEDKLMVLAPRTIKSIDHLLDASRSGLKVMVQRLGCSYTEKLLHLLGANGIRPDRIMEIGTLEGIVGLVETGVGVATMPESFVRPLLKGRKVALLLLPKEIATIQTFVVSSRNSDPSLLVTAFLDHCRGEKLSHPSHGDRQGERQAANAYTRSPHFDNSL